jgi:hypothetical protein
MVNATEWGFRMPFLVRILAGSAVLMLVTGIGQSWATEIMVRGDVCSGAVAHRPDASVTYQPGVDAYGREVAPADLSGGSAIRIPDTIAIDITVELQKRFGLPSDSALFKPEARIGTLEVDRDGTMRFNGVPVTNDEALAVQAACREALGLPPIPLPKPAEIGRASCRERVCVQV